MEEGHEFTEAAFNRLTQIKDRELYRVRTLLNAIKLNEKPSFSAQPKPTPHRSVT